MSFISDTEVVKKLGNLKAVTNDKIDPHFPAAKRDVTGLISNDTYDEYEAKATTDEDRVIISNAEAYFVLSYLLPSINISSSGDGIKRATGYNESRQENLSKAELDSYIETYRDTAERLLSPYRKLNDSTGDEVSDSVSTTHLKLISI